MKQLVNKIYIKIWKTLKHYVILMGGRGAGRSTVVSQYFLSKLTAPEYFRGAIMRFVLSDVRNSSFQEILDRAEEQGITQELDINESLMTISHGANSIHAHGFRKSSGERKSKLKSLANYSEVWIEEADEVPEGDFIQMDDSLRTTKAQVKVIMTLNSPPKSHWIITRFFKLIKSEQKEFYLPECTDGDTLYIRSSWIDNAKNIAENVKKRYEEYRTTKPSHYWNMIKGLVPEVVRGKVYSGWQIIDSIPHEARLERRGLDFGYTNDPTAGVDIYYYNGGYILDEMIYQKGMSNREIADEIGLLGPTLTVADSAEPKSIDEIKLYGVNIQPAVKGQGSVSQGIQYVKDQRISVTKRSSNIIKEYENYAWLEDKDGNTFNEPKPGYDHAMDAIRYAFTSFRPYVDTPQEEFKMYVSDFS